MNKKLKVLASAMTVLMVSATLVGCGSSSSGTTKGGQTLTIWSQYKDADFAPVKKVAEDWAKKTGNTVNIKIDTGDFSALQTAAKSSKGPDIELGEGQDNVGKYVKAGIVAEVPSSAFNSSDYVTSAAKAVKYQGKNWGIPSLIKTYALFYNKDLVSNPPTTWDELLTQAKEKGLGYDCTNFYFNYGFLSANGGYVFKMKSDGTPDIANTGLGNDGTAKGFAMIKELVDDKIISPSDTGDIAKGNFTAGKKGFYISGTWDVGAIKKAGIKFGVVPFPQINGKAVPTFGSVDVNVVTANSKNKDLAFQFLKDTASDMQKALFEEGSSIPALKALNSSKEVQNDAIAKAFSTQANAAEVMGNYPEFTVIWTPGGNILKELVSGKVTPQDAAKQLGKQVLQAASDMDK